MDGGIQAVREDWIELIGDIVYTLVWVLMRSNIARNYAKSTWWMNLNRV